MNGLKLRYLLEDLAPIEGSVLDVGCGAGSVANAVKRERPDLDVSGCDVSHSALALAQTLGEGVTFRQATAERLPFGDGEFDCVWIFDVLEHVDDPGIVLKEVARILKPGGRFHIVLPLEGQPWTLYRLLGCGTRWTAKVRHGGHIQIFSEASFRELAFSCGLPVVRTRWSYHALLQVADIAYFSWLDWRGHVSGSVEDISSSRQGVVGVAMRLTTRVIASLSWAEARTLRAVPGGCGHFSCEKSAGVS